ncbi:no significant blast hit [Histoplasma capsulatum]|uniref:No significant blast hit n=1 Tax=Ajellomyces capsulatus TaxID=5037 RepID=A0A8A1MBM4_AJECA|nr:no significant blast hit [Histoplasma capsulatum]
MTSWVEQAADTYCGGGLLVVHSCKSFGPKEPSRESASCVRACTGQKQPGKEGPSPCSRDSVMGWLFDKRGGLEDLWDYRVSCLSVPNPEAWDDNNSNKAGQKKLIAMIVPTRMVEATKHQTPPPSTASRDGESLLGVQPVDQKSLIQRGGTTERRPLVLLVP